MTATSPETTESIRFTRRIQAPPAARAVGEAAALVRPTPTVSTRRPWHPGRPAIPEPVVRVSPEAFHDIPGRPAIPEPVVRVSPEAFHDILQVSADPMVIREQRGWPLRRSHYTTQYQGYYFTTRADELRMPPGATVIFAERLQFR
jgi:hypothetical protein